VSKEEVKRQQWQKAKSDAIDIAKYVEQGPDMQNRQARIICEETFGFLQMADSNNSSSLQQTKSYLF
jgi:hypothetical protein